MSDYGGFRAIIEEARDIGLEARGRRLVACPIDGAILEETSRGWLNCPLGNFRAGPGTREGDLKAGA